MNNIDKEREKRKKQENNIMQQKMKGLNNNYYIARHARPWPVIKCCASGFYSQIHIFLPGL